MSNQPPSIGNVNNTRNTVIAIEDNFNTPETPFKMNDKPPVTTAIASNETFVALTTKPKDVDDFVNPDDVNIMKKLTVDRVANDNSDGGNRVGKKPTTYAAKKTVAQGMMDIALITSNANQLKNLIQYQQANTTFYIILLMILVSLVLQILVGVSLIFKGRFDTKGKDKAAAARVNKWVMSAVFVITIINVFIAVFSTGPPAQTSAPTGIGSNKG